MGRRRRWGAPAHGLQPRRRGLVLAAASVLLACAGAACGSFGSEDPATPGSEGGATSEGGEATTKEASVADASAPDHATLDGTMVAVGGFFIDSHEVTFGEYADLVDAVGNGRFTPTLPARCSAKTVFTPPGGCTSAVALGADHPASCVDWCDAFAYCQFRGKRLCGRIGGGAVDPTLATADQWTTACAGSAGNSYPYGNTANPGACHTLADGGGGYPAPVESAPACVGSVPGLFDMSGNVWEWEDKCSAPVPKQKDVCSIRGGSVANPVASASCSAEERHAFDFASYNVGFRCCADP